MTGRYVVTEVWCDGNPVDLQTYDSLTDALDRRDQERKERPGVPSRGPLFFVHDLDDPERGQLDHDDLYEEVA